MAEPRPGDLWRYDYLWHWQAKGGETEGRKTRPTSIVALTHSAAGATHLFLLPITTKAPDPARLAIEVPPIEARRAGLDAGHPCWIILDEFNHDILESSWYFDPAARIGRFGDTFHRQVMRLFEAALRARRTTRIPRRD